MKIYTGNAKPSRVEPEEFVYNHPNGYIVVEDKLQELQLELALAWARMELSLAECGRALDCSSMVFYGRAARALAQAIRSGRLKDVG